MVTLQKRITSGRISLYFTDAVAWASENKIVSGYGNGIFGPENSITREQLAEDHLAC